MIGALARRVFATFVWNPATNAEEIQPVLDQFEAYCRPRRDVPFERYKFYKRQQQAGETFDKYVTELRHLAINCNSDHISPEEILRGRILFGIADGWGGELLLRKDDLTLAEVLQTVRASELSNAQMRELDGLYLGVAGGERGASTKEKQTRKDEGTNRRVQVLW